MTITDNEVKKIVRYINMAELTESLESFPDSERRGRSDLYVLLDEIGYFIEMYETDGTVYSEDLYNSRTILRRTKNGKLVPISTVTFRPIYSYGDISNAKSTVAEYRRLYRGRNKAEKLFDERRLSV